MKLFMCLFLFAGIRARSGNSNVPRSTCDFLHRNSDTRLNKSFSSVPYTLRKSVVNVVSVG